ncbi:MAG: hypothetical protein COX57_06625 [Alphaproteobacteria bacterium CG_4_10_14_0_2_um_filter_63_37]|nr:MAG: hypothetical protein AUJ55_00090 [Proteobacteria bacterium CG1_02_64_396]PJA24798.1 MAG: hypothetical protein COX57_06625 [Alphaproteobacteria bacterium CG_4_10_14_0_2_um_filter_63_37]
MTYSSATPVLFDPPFLAEQEPVWRALTALDQMLEGLQGGRSVSLEGVSRLIDRMIDDMEAGGELDCHWQRWLVRFVYGRFQIDGIAPEHLGWLARILHRMVVALKTGAALKLSRTHLHDLGLAALLHDCGAFLLLGQGRVTTAEVHAAIFRGWEWLLPFESERWSGIAMGAMERLDGSGYPEKLKTDAVGLEARIIGLVASFQAVVQPREYRTSLLPGMALDLLLKKERDKFDPKVAKALLDALTPYPPGSLVLVEGVGVGEVLVSRGQTPVRPLVGVVLGTRMKDEGVHPRRIDLRDNAMVFVSRCFSLSALPDEQWSRFDPPLGKAVGAVHIVQTVDETTPDPLEHPFFQLLPEAMRQGLSTQALAPCPMETGQTLMREGEQADFMVLILTGQVAILEPGSADRIIARRGPGSTIGEMGLFEGVRQNSVRVESSGSYVRLPYPEVRALQERLPNLREALEVLHRLHSISAL